MVFDWDWRRRQGDCIKAGGDRWSFSRRVCLMQARRSASSQKKKQGARAPTQTAQKADRVCNPRWPRRLTRRGAVHVARVLEELRGAPQRPHARALLELQGDLGDGVEVAVGLLQGGALGRDVAVAALKFGRRLGGVWAREEGGLLLI